MVRAPVSNAPVTRVVKFASSPCGGEDAAPYLAGEFPLERSSAMSIADVLHGKSRIVHKVGPKDTVLTAVAKLAEHRIGAVVVEDDWMRLVGIFSERDFVNATAQHGAEA